MFTKIFFTFLSTLLLAQYLPLPGPTVVHANDFDSAQKFSITDDDVIASDPLSYDQLVQRVMLNEQLSKNEAIQFLNIGPQQRNGTYFREYTYTVTVTSTYKPAVIFYCQTSEWDTYRGILKVLNTSLRRDYNGSSKQFTGNLYTNLENAYTIYFVLNGDFYNNGSTTYSGGGGISVGGSSSVNFSISYASNHYKYLYTTGRYRLY